MKLEKYFCTRTHLLILLSLLINPFLSCQNHKDILPLNSGLTAYLKLINEDNNSYYDTIDIPFQYTNGSADTQIYSLCSELNYFKPNFPERVVPNAIWNNEVPYQSNWYYLGCSIENLERWKEIEIIKSKSEKLATYKWMLLKQNREISSCFFVPDLSLHFIDIDNDNVEDLIVYDGNGGDGCIVNYYQINDSLLLKINIIEGWETRKIEKNQNSIRLVTYFNSYWDLYFKNAARGYEAIDITDISMEKSKLKITPYSRIICLKGITKSVKLVFDSLFVTRKVSFLNCGQKYVMTNNTNLPPDSIIFKYEESILKYPNSSFGYAFAHKDNKFFVAMCNNKSPIDNFFKDDFEYWVNNKNLPYYILGWIDEKDIEFLK